MRPTSTRKRISRRGFRIEQLEARQLLASISGVAWHDLDSNGMREASEPSLGGWTAYLDTNDNRELDDGEPTSVTTLDDLDTPGVDEGGAYTFGGLAAGDYVVRMVERPLWQATFPLEANVSFGKLAFVESLKNGEQDRQGTAVAGLDEPIESAVSPDGKDLYVLSDPTFADQGLQHFRPGGATGQLTFQSDYANGSDDGHGNTINGVGDPREVHISPDGKFLYVNSGGRDSLAIFSRNDSSGELTFLEHLSDGGTDAAGNSTSRLDHLRSVVISADGNFLYGAADSFFDKGINVFRRDLATGRLTLVETILDDATNHLNSLADMAISPDGNHLYAVSERENAVTMFTRDLATGRLTFVEEILDSQVAEITDVSSLAISADGEHVYVTARGDDAVTTFDRNPTTGQLTYASAVVYTQMDSAGNSLDNLLDPTDVTISADGEHVYVTALGNAFADLGGVNVFQRDSLTGALTLIEVLEHDEVDHEGNTVTEQNSATSFTLTPDGQFAYVTALRSDSLVTYDREHLTTQAAAHELTLQAADSVTGVDFGFVSLTGVIVGTKWHDWNRNGVRDSGEPTLTDWTIYLDTNGNGIRDAGERSVRTATDDPTTTTIDETGTYRFADLFPGEYKVAELLPERWEQIYPGGDLTHEVTLTAGLAQGSHDFGNKRLEDIYGTKWFDEDGDGHRNEELSISSSADIVFAIDVSASAADSYASAVVGDQNGDGLANTELDAAIDSYKAINQRLIELGLGSSTEVSIVLFASTATHLDMNVVGGGLQISTTPATDADNNGRPDVEQILESITQSGHGLSTLTNYEAALHEADDLFDMLGTAAGDGVIYLLTGSIPTTGGSFLGEVRQFAASGVDLRPIGLGAGAPLHDLTKINPTAVAITSREELLVAANLNQSSEPGLVGWTIYLDTNDNGQLDNGELSAVTRDDDPATPFIDEAGTYELLNVGAGTHRIREIQQFGYQQTFPLRPDDHLITIPVGQFAASVDFGNEAVAVGTLSGSMWSDTNNNGVRDPGEPGQSGESIYLDLNNNAEFDGGEPLTTTSLDGSYEFSGVPIGTHIVREIVPVGFTRTFPNELVVIDPDGVNNPPVGIVSPTLVDLQLLPGMTSTQSVSLTLPADSVSRKVDILLQMDASASFDFIVSDLADEFLTLITDIQALFPDIDFAFGVSRHEDYGGLNYLGNVFGETVQRPFILSQPIITTDTPGFLTAIEEALERETPGSGGDNNESLFEGLFHAATGRGFDADGDDDLFGSGVAGPSDTQTMPGLSGDVPPFSSFLPDLENNILPPAGSIGGVGFRAGALPIIIAANDYGARVNLDATDPIVGLNGVTVPREDFDVGFFASHNTPDSDGDGIDDGITVQQTIDALLDIGAVVIGMGSDGFDTNRPLIEPIALLTGATNGTNQSIPSGDEDDPIDPGDPFYFRITNNIPRVTEAIQLAIQAAVSQVRYDIDIIASDPNVTITNLSGIAAQAGPGDTVSFDVEFTGESLPRRFDLQFVVAGTSSVLGSIPVEISTILAEPGAHVVTLAPGESAADLDFGNFGQIVATGVQGRHVFYNNSAFDGNNPAANSDDDAAIAVDKTALLPGSTAQFENYTSYARGINGIMVDLARSGADPITAADFQFRVGNVDNTSTWNPAAPAKSITTRAGEGVNGSDRVTITWNDGLIRGQWLEVSVLTSAATELSSADVFYFGNAPGETGDSATDALVDADDFVATRANPSNFLAPAVIVDRYDHNRDRHVNATDLVVVRDHVSSVATALRLLDLSSPLLAKPAAAKSVAIALDRSSSKRNAAEPTADRRSLSNIDQSLPSDGIDQQLLDQVLAEWSANPADALESESDLAGEASRLGPLDLEVDFERAV